MNKKLKKSIIFVLSIITFCVLNFEEGNTKVYYVDSYSQKGGDGTTQETYGKHAAWKYITQIQGLTPGDQLLLKRGSVWRERLLLTCQGTENNPICVSCYGKGPKPIIIGSESLLKKQEKWVKVENCLWKISLPQQCNTVVFNNKKTGEFNLCPAQKYEWSWKKGEFLIYSEGPPYKYYQEIEASQRKDGIKLLNASHVIVSNIAIINVNERGITVYGDNNEKSINNKIKFCEISRCSESGIFIINGEKIQIDNTKISDCKKSGITIINIDNILLTNNHTNRNKKHGIHLQSWRGYSNQRIKNFTIKNCISKHNYASGICLQGNVQNGIIVDCETEKNGENLPGGGIYVGGRSGTPYRKNPQNIKVFFNKCFEQIKQKADGSGILIDHYVTDIFIKGNVCFDNEADGILVNSAYSVKLENNLVYNNNDNGIGTTNSANAKRMELIIKNNTILLNDDDGIHVHRDINDCNISRNLIIWNRKAGIYCQRPGKHIKQSGNCVSQNKQGDFVLGMKRESDLATK